MKKKFWKSVLAVFCVLALTAGILPAAFATEEDDFIYVNGEAKVFTAAGELSAILRLPVEVPGRIHILTSGVNISLAIYDEETFELFGVYYTENGLIDVPFDAYPGTFLLGFSGWGEVAVLVADEGTTAQLYANAQAAEKPVEEWDEEPFEEAGEESAEETAGESVEEAPAEETPATEDAEAPAEEPVEELNDEQVENAEKFVEEPVEIPAGEAVGEIAEGPDENAEEVAEPVEETAEKEYAEAEVPTEDTLTSVEPVEESMEEPAYYDPAVPINYEFSGSGTVSVLSILNGVGAPVNMVMEVTRETDGFFSAFGGSDGDWRLTPFAYFDGIEVSVRAGYYNASDGSIKEAVYTMILSYPDPAQPEKTVEEIPAVPAEETIEAPVEEETVKEPVEAPAEQLTEEIMEESVEEPEQGSVEVQEETSAKEAAEEPTEEMVEEPAEQPAYYDPAVPIDYEFTGNGTVSVISILKEVGAPVNMVLEVTRDTDGWFFATGSSDGDWLLTPFAYFERIEVSVRAGYYDASNGSITDAVYTLNLSYPDPNAKEEAIAEEAEEIEVTIAVERREGNEIRLFAENLGEEDSEKYIYQWQYSLDNEEWLALEGANGREYTFRLDQTNGRYYWRLIVTEKE